MAIVIEKDDRLFTLCTKNSMYQMKADDKGILLHTYYGRKTDICDYSYLIQRRDHGFSGNPDEAAGDRTYSTDTLPQEYSSFGSGDYRESALDIRYDNGTRTLGLRYEGYEIIKGKYSIPGLPAMYADENEAETLVITLRDDVQDVRVKLYYGVVEDLDVITRSVSVENHGKAPVQLERVMSLCLDQPYGDWDWMTFYGKHEMERQLSRTPIHHGVQSVGSLRGASSHQYNPFVMLADKNATETSGECYGFSLLYSGNFLAAAEKDQFDQTRLIMGIHPGNFEFLLREGEIFHAPEVMMVYSAEGFEKMSNCYHKAVREHVCRGRFKLERRPVLINNWEGTYFDFTGEKLLEMAKEAASCGVELFVMDDGWFGKRNSDTSGLGDWFVNENKLKGGLSMLADKINDLGMKLGIWFEPEMVSEDSHLYRAHPDWAIAIPDRKPMRGRFQLVLDMSRREVQDYLFIAISNILDNANISYIKWDMNRSISDLYSHALPAERQGELSHRYILGLYSLLERLIQKYPNVLFEGCSGGGGRFDAGMLYYCPQIWCSDDTDAFERTKIQYGTSFIYPISAVGSHVSVVPNHQTGRITPLEARAVTAMAGSFGYELDLGLLTDEEKTAVADQIRRFKNFDTLIHNGSYYRLTNPMNGNRAFWSYVSDDRSEALVHGMIYHVPANMKRSALRLSGLDENSLYSISGTKETYSGAALMNGGILLPMPWGDYTPVEIHLKKVK